MTPEQQFKAQLKLNIIAQLKDKGPAEWEEAFRWITREDTIVKATLVQG